MSHWPRPTNLLSCSLTRRVRSSSGTRVVLFSPTSSARMLRPVPRPWLLVSAVHSLSWSRSERVSGRHRPSAPSSGVKSQLTTLRRLLVNKFEMTWSKYDAGQVYIRAVNSEIDLQHEPSVCVHEQCMK
ncbi:hypothetical protein AYX14_07029 [Cryptococcus neoformans]|nr:hypothetical protein AYX14_07029 [Cryptococcus neoformans var. grubii]